MGLETGTRTTDLVVTNPTATDVRSAGDDHLRLIKTTTKNDLLAVLGAQAKQDITVASGAIAPAALSSAIINLTGEASVADNLDTITATNKYSGNLIMLKGANAAEPVTVRDNSVGAGNIYTIRQKSAVLNTAGEYILLWYDGTNWNEIIRGDLSEILDGDTIAALTVTTLTASGGTLTSVTLATPTITTPTMTASGWPSFLVRATGQTISAGATTKVQFGTETFDTNNNFDAATNHRFLPTVAGKYQLSVGIIGNTGTSGDRARMDIYKNGVSITRQVEYIGASGDFSLAFSLLVDADGSTDYYEVFAVSISNSFILEGNCWFSGSRVA